MFPGLAGFAKMCVEKIAKANHNKMGNNMLPMFIPMLLAQSQQKRGEKIDPWNLTEIYTLSQSMFCLLF